MIEVSIVVPTYNRVERLKRVIAALEQQDYAHENYELIVVSDGSTDGTQAYLENLSPSVKFSQCTQVNQGPAAARNRGVAMASGQFVLFIDDDVIPEPGLVREHMSVHQCHEGNTIVIGPMVTPSDVKLSPWVNWEQKQLEKYYNAMLSGRYPPSARLFYTGNASVPRKYFMQCGGFDQSLRRAEDIELAYRLERLGLQFHFNPQAVGFHYAERSFESWMETANTYGRNDIIFSLERDQPDLLEDILRNFHYRNILVKVLIKLCLDRPRLTDASTQVMKATMHLADQLNQEKIALAACSGIFNLHYFQGISDQLGGEKVLLQELHRVEQRIDHV
jgi:glycosyltransferase involved in cell wall biosynthesis